MSDPAVAELWHSSAVAFATDTRWAGILITGRSGAGKSELALELMGLGARLVADDQTELKREGDEVVLRAPARLRGMIELRGMGLLQAPPLEQATLALLVDLDEPETDRLPQPYVAHCLGRPVPRLRRVDTRVFAIGVKHYVLFGKAVQE